MNGQHNKKEGILFRHLLSASIKAFSLHRTMFNSIINRQIAKTKNSPASYHNATRSPVQLN